MIIQLKKRGQESAKALNGVSSSEDAPGLSRAQVRARVKVVIQPVTKYCSAYAVDRIVCVTKPFIAKIRLHFQFSVSMSTAVCDKWYYECCRKVTTTYRCEIGDNLS